MFETILERILLQTLGEYLEGIDRAKLRLEIWKGQVNFENLSIKPSAIRSLEMPFKMEFSQIRKFSMKFPWKNITKSPVALEIDDLFLIMSPLDSQKWRHADFDNAAKKMQKIDDIEERFKNRFREALEKSGNKDKNFSKKLVKGIIDNMQVILEFFV